MSSVYGMTLETPPCDMDHLKARCIEVGECWEWKSTCRAGRWPTIAWRLRMPDGEVKCAYFYVRHLSYWIDKGRKPALDHGKALVPHCGNALCINPAHLRITTRSEVGAKASREGRYTAPMRNARLAETKRKNSKLSDQAVVEIRASDEPAKTLAQRFSISLAYVYMIRNGEWRKDYSNPFAQLMGQRA